MAAIVASTPALSPTSSAPVDSQNERELREQVQQLQSQIVNLESETATAALVMDDMQGLTEHELIEHSFASERYDGNAVELFDISDTVHELAVESDVQMRAMMHTQADISDSAELAIVDLDGHNIRTQRDVQTHRQSVAKLRSELFDSVESEMQKATKKVESEMQKATKEMQEHLTEEVRQGVERLVQSTHDSMTTTVMQPNTIHDAASRAKLVHIRETSSREHMVAMEQQQRGVSMGAMLRKVQARTISVLRDFGEVGAPL